MAFELDFHALEQAISRSDARPGILDGRVLKAALLEQLARAVHRAEGAEAAAVVAVA